MKRDIKINYWLIILLCFVVGFLLAVSCSKEEEVVDGCPCQEVIIHGRHYTFPFCDEEEKEIWETLASTKEAELRAERKECIE